MNKNVIEATTATAGNLFAWLAHSEQIWFGIAGTYVQFLAPNLNLPDLRGPFLFLTLLYLGFRLADLWEKKDEIEGMS